MAVCALLGHRPLSRLGVPSLPVCLSGAAVGALNFGQSLLSIWCDLVDCQIVWLD